MLLATEISNPANLTMSSHGGPTSASATEYQDGQGRTVQTVSRGAGRQRQPGYSAALSPTTPWEG